MPHLEHRADAPGSKFVVAECFGEGPFAGSLAIGNGALRKVMRGARIRHTPPRAVRSTERARER